MKWLLLLFVIINFSSCNLDDLYLGYRYDNTLHPEYDSIFAPSNNSFRGILLQDYTYDGKIYYICKIWGLLNYHQLNYGNHIAIYDSLFKLVIDRRYCNKVNFNLGLAQILNYVATEKVVTKNTLHYPLIDNRWFFDSVYFTKEIQQKLLRIWLSSEGAEHVEFSNLGVPQVDNENGDINFLDVKQRLKSLFTYWNSINYFYVDKIYTSKNWDSVLIKFIPQFISSNTEKAYHLVVQRLTSQINDSHSNVDPFVLNLLGDYVPNFRLVKLHDSFVVTKIRTNLLNTSNICVGDLIMDINGKPIKSIYDSLYAYYSGSNEWSTQRMLTRLSLCSHKKQNTLKIRRKNKVIEKHVTFYSIDTMVKKQELSNRVFENNPAFVKLNDSIGYIHINWLFDENIAVTLQSVNTLKAIILDLRGYPNSTITFKLFDFFVAGQVSFFKTTYVDPKHPGCLKFTTGFKIGNSNAEEVYKGKLVLLVNEETQSQAEFLCMGLQKSKSVITIGNTSAGADGNVALLTIAPKIPIIFSGIGIYYHDFTVTQRNGVKIDCKIDYSYKTIKNRKDATLMKAIDLLTKY
jgi:carboxyl-terminal processing protease